MPWHHFYTGFDETSWYFLTRNHFSQFFIGGLGWWACGPPAPVFPEYSTGLLPFRIDSAHILSFMDGPLWVPLVDKIYRRLPDSLSEWLACADFSLLVPCWAYAHEPRGGRVSSSNIFRSIMAWTRGPRGTYSSILASKSDVNIGDRKSVV